MPFQSVIGMQLLKLADTIATMLNTCRSFAELHCGASSGHSCRYTQLEFSVSHSA